MTMEMSTGIRAFELYVPLPIHLHVAMGEHIIIGWRITFACYKYFLIL